MTDKEFVVSDELTTQPAPERRDPTCATCGRDNRNGTHDALERFGHLSHGFRPGPQECSPDADENGCTNNPTGCTCTIEGGCGEASEAGCCDCRHSDPYLPCPLFGFMCDPECGDPEDPCCTAEQQAASREHFAIGLAAVSP